MLHILSIAPCSSVQDQGRPGWREIGVPQGGALDDWSLAVANALVGNAQRMAGLEIGFGRSALRFSRPALVAFAGARTPISAGRQALPRWRPVAIPAGCTIEIGPAQAGSRLYLAVAGGIGGDWVLGSRCGSVHSSIGPGMLRRGDALRLAAAAPASSVAAASASMGLRIASWWADAESLLDLDGTAPLRLLPGAHGQRLEDPGALLTKVWQMSPQANRMAAPLLGPRLAIRDADCLLSEPVFPGTLQLPPDGRPILLLAEAQTVGGYARIGHLASVDLARIAQRPARAALRFEPIGAEAARRLWCWRQQRLARLRIAAAARLQAAGWGP